MELKIAEARSDIEGLRSYVEKRFNEPTKWTVGRGTAETALVIAVLR